MRYTIAGLQRTNTEQANEIASLRSQVRDLAGRLELRESALRASENRCAELETKSAHFEELYAIKSAQFDDYFRLLFQAGRFIAGPGAEVPYWLKRLRNHAYGAFPGERK